MTANTNNCPLIINKELCWKAGMDEELVINYKHKNEYEEVVVTDITGYTATLEIRAKDTDVFATLTIEADIDALGGQFLFQANKTQTANLLTNTRRNIYSYKVIITNPSNQSKVRAEGKLNVNL